MTSPKPTRSELWNAVFTNKGQEQPAAPASFDAFEAPVSRTASVEPRTNSLAPLVQNQSQTPKYHNNTNGVGTNNHHNFKKDYYNAPPGAAQNKFLQVDDNYRIDKQLQPPSTPQPTTKQRVQTVLQSKVVVAVIVSVCVLLLLVVLNPPFAQKPDESGKRSPMRILTWSLVFGLLAFVLPMGAGIFSSS